MAKDDIEAACEKVEMDTEFTRRDTLYLASCKEDIPRLEEEYELLKQHGFMLDLLTQKEIETKYPFSREAAIYSYGDGELNPFKYTHALFDYAAKRKVRIFENTEMNGHHYDKQEKRMVITTKAGYSIKAGKVIFATGYEGTELKQEKTVSFVSTYTVTTNKVDDLSSWNNRSLIWETARPYLYMRTTADNRIIIGGLDENTDSAEERDSMLMHKKDKLIEELKNMFPELDVKPAYYLAGFYGGTKDGLPIIGIYDEYPDSYFLFGFGDNGTVYSQLLAKIIATKILEGDSPDLAFYLQDRPLLTGK